METIQSSHQDCVVSSLFLQQLSRLIIRIVGLSIRVNDKVREQEGLTLKQFLIIWEQNTGNWVDMTVIVFV